VVQKSCRMTGGANIGGHALTKLVTSEAS